MKPQFMGILFAMCAWLAGCAGVEVTAIPFGEAGTEADKVATGFRYYETSPFLLIYTDGKGGLVSKLLYLPDMTKKRSIKAYAYLSSNNSTLKFENGTLLQATAVVDETIIPTVVLSNLAKVAIAAAAANSKGTKATQDTIPAPYLFRIVQDGENWKLSSDQKGRIPIRYLPGGAE